MTEVTQPADATPVLRYASRVLLLDESDRLLLFRSDGLFTAGDFVATSLWYPPGGGREGNETPEETATRELREETGLQALEACDLFKRRLHGDAASQGTPQVNAAEAKTARRADDLRVAPVRRAQGPEAQSWLIEMREDPIPPLKRRLWRPEATGAS